MILALGNLGNLEVILFNTNSLYGKVSILRHSKDPEAVSIAQQELLELLHLVPNIYDAPEDLSTAGNHTSGPMMQATA